MTQLFDNIGDNIRKIAKVLFYICFIGGIAVLLIGLLRFLGSIDEYTTFSEALNCTLEDAIRWKSLYADAYYGRMQIKTGFYITLSGFTALPLYAIGEIVFSCQEIRRNTAELVNKIKDKE